MSIQVDYGPSPSTYGAAMYNTGKNLQNNDTYQKMLQLMLQNKQLNQQYSMQQQQLAYEKSIHPAVLGGFNYVTPGGGGYGAAQGAMGQFSGPLGTPPGFMDNYGWHPQQ